MTAVSPTCKRGARAPHRVVALSTVLPMRSDEQPRDLETEPPPFGGSWRRLYAIVVGALLVEIVLFALFTVAFR